MTGGPTVGVGGTRQKRHFGGLKCGKVKRRQKQSPWKKAWERLWDEFGGQKEFRT